MAKLRKRKRIILRDNLSKVSGEDYKLIHHANTDSQVKNSFAFIGAFVLAIFGVSFYSSAHFIYHLFNKNLVVALPVATLWGIMIAIIYLLMLYTITPRILITNYKSQSALTVDRRENKSFFSNLSNSFRIGFVVLIAIIIAQPWLISTFPTNEALEKYKQTYRNDFIVKADSLLIFKEMKLFEDAKREFNMIVKSKADSALFIEGGQVLFNKINEDALFLTTSFYLKETLEKIKKQPGFKKRKVIDSINQEITVLVEREVSADSQFVLTSKTKSSFYNPISLILDTLNKNLLYLIQQKNAHYKKLNEVLGESNYYVRKIQIINSTYPIAWLMTGTVILTFIIPIVLKYRIRNTTNFYEVKKELEKKIILEDYSIFKKQYSKIFTDRYNTEVSFYERYEDPPFNCFRKGDLSFYKNEQILLNQIYDTDESSEENKYFVFETLSS